MVNIVNDADFDKNISSGVVIVDFYADWCGPCKQIAPVLDQLSKDYDGKITILKMNVDDNQVVPSKFGIRSIPTLIAFKNGNKVDIKVGSLSKPQLTDWINSLIG